jgi:hypothetical protein
VPAASEDDAFGFTRDPWEGQLEGDGFGGADAPVGAAFIAPEFIEPDADAFGFGDEEAAPASPAAPSAAPSTLPPVPSTPVPSLPEFGSPAFDAAPASVQLTVAITAGLLPGHTTLAEYMSLRGEVPEEATPLSPSPAKPQASSFLDDFVGGTGDYDEEEEQAAAGVRRMSSAASLEVERAHVEVQAAAVAAAARIHAAHSGPAKASFDDFSEQAETGVLDDFDAPPPPTPPTVGRGAGAAPAPAYAPEFGFDDFDAQAAAPPTCSGASAARFEPSMHDFGFEAPPASIASPSAGATVRTPAVAPPAAASPRRDTGVAFSGSDSGSGEAFEDFGFGSSTPKRAVVKMSAPVPVPAVVAQPALDGIAAPPPAPAAPSLLTADASAALLSRPPLPAPAAPVLSDASIGSLTLSWPPVVGADGYFIDLEPRSRMGADGAIAAEGVWTGAGTRALVHGKALIAVPTAVATGLQPDALYVARVTAVRILPVRLPNGVSVEALEESPAGAMSALLRTLNPAAELGRLAADNDRLAGIAATIPGIKSALAVSEQALSGTGAQLAQAKVEIVRLTGDLNSRLRELNEAATEADRLQGDIADRDATIAAEMSEVMRLTGELEDTVTVLESSTAEGVRLTADVADRDASLAAGAEREAAGEATIKTREAELVAVRAKLADTEAHLRSEKAGRADLQAKYDVAALQVRAPPPLSPRVPRPLTPPPPLAGEINGQRPRLGHLEALGGRGDGDGGDGPRAEGAPHRAGHCGRAPARRRRRARHPPPAGCVGRGHGGHRRRHVPRYEPEPHQPHDGLAEAGTPADNHAMRRFARN